MDLEDLALQLLSTTNAKGTPRSRTTVLKELSKHVDKAFAEALLVEMEAASELIAASVDEEKPGLEYDHEGIDPEVLALVRPVRTDISAGTAGMGCRGEGDLLVHRLIADIVGEQGAVVGVEAQDDGGAVASEQGTIVISVDGVHSRLSAFPFLAGFYVAQAAMRDTLVMGARPLALLADVHLGDDGDVAKVFEFTAGITSLSDIFNVPLVAGSTLRIGGDLVKGSRLSGAVGAVGLVPGSEGGRPLRRSAIKAGDSVLLTVGSGGGTIATTAIFNRRAEVLERTLNVDFLRAAYAVLNSKHAVDVHTMSDITNGGVRGDMLDLADASGLGLLLSNEMLLRSVDPEVRTMLEELDIDPLGVSTDSLMIVAPPAAIRNISQLLDGIGITSLIVGEVTSTPGARMLKDGRTMGLERQFRESPYTPVKKVVAVETADLKALKGGLEKGALEAMFKKERLKRILGDDVGA